MKRKLSYLLIIFISMFMYSGEVRAAELLFRCEYKVNLSSFATAAENKDITYYVDVYDKSKAKDAIAVSDFSSVRETVLNNVYSIAIHSGFKKNFKEATDKSTSCPTINFEYDGNSTFTMNTGSYTGEDSISSYGKIIEKGKDVEEDEVEKICSRTKDLREENEKVEITFYLQGGDKMWSIKTFYNNKESGNSSGSVTEMLSLSDKTFDLEQGVIDTLFKDKSSCKNSKIYLRTPPTSKLNTITLTEPDPSENGSYPIGETDEDTGLDPDPGDEDDDEIEVTDDETLKIVKRIYDIIKILIPVLIIILSTVDFLKVIMYDDEKNYKSAFDKLVKRLVVGVVFFLLPILVSFIIKYSGIDVKQLYLEIFK